jgi:hypothetical protein
MYLYILVGKTWGKKPLGRACTAYEDNIKIALKGIGFHLSEDRVQWRYRVDTVMNLRFPLKGVEFIE